MARRDPMFHARVEALADYLADAGVLTDPRWRAALHEVPRGRFVPPRAYAASFLPDEPDRVIDRAADRAGWLNAVYRNFSIVTQRDDGATDPADTTGTPTCSLSCPHIAMQYLELLDLDDHHRMLEIGTGTGWTAAMLAWRLGGRNVVTVEVDKDLAEAAREHVKRVEQDPQVVTGDGAGGHPPRAPYDRVHVTCGVRDIPRAWIAQTRPGGQIVLPYMPVTGAGGHQLRLDVIDPCNTTAVGRFTGGGGFMMLRSQRTIPPGDPDTAQETTREMARAGDQGTTRMDPRLIAQADAGAQLAIAALVPGLSVGTGWTKTPAGEWAYTATLTTGDAWAHCQAPRGADEYTVHQHGDRRLWDEAASAYRWWLGKGRPDRGRYGITITHDRQTLWLDQPSTTVG
ncbi:protein-L-isoaspartate(D-aspartate) O-methyltransferase [Actinomadura graeca]|uniref:Protein-L-isoaspartate O-methyltransferase n=1 Tax=Actinomadura graeca TaxID=2750812 RepID=A0ABX8R6H6_9ACTN|nr:rRNA adenine N-6-methyltransferase family protein [Actinomadura graeca]QXJ25854.1 protein-L-isoaspartate(D-aspartate) O-methyltransferase [Actinomadura graeca]